MRLAALELGPPAGSGRPATGNRKQQRCGRRRRRHLPWRLAAAEGLADLCAFGAGRALLALLRQWAAANESTGVAAEGGLLQQVDRLIALLFGGPQGGAPEEVR